MANTIHQHGSGDNIAGDKVMGDKVQGDKIGTQVNGGNIGNLVNASGNVTGFSQTSGITTAELLQIVDRLRQTAAQLPAEVRDDLIIDIDDVEAEIQKPEAQRSLPKLKKRLTALATAAAVLAGGMSAANSFADDVIELGSKIGIELQLPSSNQP